MLNELNMTPPRDFWGKILFGDFQPLYVSESHSAMEHILKFFPSGCEVTLLDAHHDCGYGQDSEATCGNWAARSLKSKKVSKLHLYYPEWRRTCPEPSHETHPTSVNYGLPPQPTLYDVVHMCRSGAWTPPWFDSKLRKLIKESKLKVQYIDDYITKKRSPATIEEAKAIASSAANP